MENAKRLLIFCDMCVDIIASGDEVVPEFGQKEKLLDELWVELGGSCSIFSFQAAKLGMDVTVVGKVGDDTFGQFILNRFTEVGIDTNQILVDKSMKTGAGILLCKPDTRAILTYIGALDGLTIDEVPEQLLQSNMHLHIGSYFLLKNLQPHWIEIVTKIKQMGGTVSLDTNWDPDENWDNGLQELLPYIDVFLPNENELLAISGLDDVKKALEKLGAKVGIVVAKLGERGAVAYHKGHMYYGEPRKVSYVDSIGAGDSFDAGFIYGYLQGFSIEKCLEIGNLCGAYNTTEFGGTAGQIGKIDLDRYMKRSYIK